MASIFFKGSSLCIPTASHQIKDMMSCVSTLSDFKLTGGSGPVRSWHTSNLQRVSLICFKLSYVSYQIFICLMCFIYHDYYFSLVLRESPFKIVSVPFAMIPGVFDSGFDFRHNKYSSPISTAATPEPELVVSPRSPCPY